MPKANFVQIVKDALQKRSAVPARGGFVATWQENLFPGLDYVSIKKDLDQGSGGELSGNPPKFCALHSSSALGVNTFGSFRQAPAGLTVNGHTGFTGLQFEMRLPLGFQIVPPETRLPGLLGQAPANVDVWLESENEVLAIESKFTEHLAPQDSHFTDSYSRARLPHADDAWWNARTAAQSSGQFTLKTSQIVKHALGLFEWQRTRPDKKITLLYLFWEPVDAAEYPLFADHRRQVRDLAAVVANSSIRFEYLSYPELWSQWDQVPALQSHLAHLRARYSFALR